MNSMTPGDPLLLLELVFIIFEFTIATGTVVEVGAKSDFMFTATVYLLLLLLFAAIELPKDVWEVVDELPIERSSADIGAATSAER